MLKRVVPGRTRRTCGYVCVTLASVLIGYAAWAAEPALGVTQEARPSENPVQLRGGMSVITIDDRRMLLGVSSGVDGQIDNIFLYTSQGPMDMKLSLNEAPSTIDYRPDIGLRFTLPDPRQHATSGFAIFLRHGGGASSMEQSSVTPKVENAIGVSLGLSHYVMDPALCPSEFQALSKTDDCNGDKTPCIRAGGKIIPFPG
jgi:hypothetical protein